MHQDFFLCIIVYVSLYELVYRVPYPRKYPDILHLFVLKFSLEVLLSPVVLF